MPMNWDLTETDLAKNKDKDDWHREAWKWIFSNMNPDKPKKDKQGRTWHPMGYDFVWVLTTWTYHTKGGCYGDRGAEMLRGTQFCFEKSDIPQMMKDLKITGDKDVIKIIEKLVGLRVWATQKIS